MPRAKADTCKTCGATRTKNPDGGYTIKAEPPRHGACLTYGHKFPYPKKEQDETPPERTTK